MMRHLMLAACVATFAGCGVPYDYGVLRNHVLSVDPEGNAYDPESNRPVDVDERVEGMLAAADAAMPGDQPVKLLIHVHGGLNSASDSLTTAFRATQRMQQESRPDDRYYPLFVTWPSLFSLTYMEHLFELRQGRHAPIWGPISSPGYFVTDLAGAVAEAPRNLIHQIGSDAAVGIKIGFDGNALPSWQNSDQIYAVLKGTDKPFRGVVCGDYSRGVMTQGLRFVWYWITFAPSLVLSTIGLEGFGQGSWEAQLHRASNLFNAYDEFDVRTVGKGDAETMKAITTHPTGAFAQMLFTLAKHIEKHKDRHYEIVLVGHSMGAIILNDALRFLSSENVCKCIIKEPLPIRDIVYMAPACSVGEAADSVVPFLEANAHTQFHLLTLHPLAEAEELNAYGFIARGSLLEWIDNFFSRPTGPRERRLGKWVNVMQSLHLFRAIADRMTIKAFGVDGDSKPQMHGQFNECPFWRSEFWMPDGPLLW